MSAVAVACGGMLVSTQMAVADEEICGYRVWDVERDGLDLQGFLQDGQGRVNDLVRRSLGLGKEVCAPLRFAVEVLAPSFTPGLTPVLAPFRSFQVTLPTGVKYVLLVRRAYEQAQMPSELPAVGASGVQAPVTWTGSAGLWLNSEPGAGNTLKLLPEGTMLKVTCQVSGPAVNGPNGRTDLWDYATTPVGDTGYVSDAYVNTGVNSRIAPAC